MLLVAARRLDSLRKPGSFFDFGFIAYPGGSQLQVWRRAFSAESLDQRSKLRPPPGRPFFLYRQKSRGPSCCRAAGAVGFARAGTQHPKHSNKPVICHLFLSTGLLPRNRGQRSWAAGWAPRQELAATHSLMSIIAERRPSPLLRLGLGLLGTPGPFLEGRQREARCFPWASRDGPFGRRVAAHATPFAEIEFGRRKPLSFQP